MLGTVASGRTDGLRSPRPPTPPPSPPPPPGESFPVVFPRLLFCSLFSSPSSTLSFPGRARDGATSVNPLIALGVRGVRPRGVLGNGKVHSTAEDKVGGERVSATLPQLVSKLRSNWSLSHDWHLEIVIIKLRTAHYHVRELCVTIPLL